MKTPINILAGLLVLVGLVLVLPGAIMWDALQIQAAIGNSAPLTNAAIQMAFGVLCLVLAWVVLHLTRNL